MVACSLLTVHARFKNRALGLGLEIVISWTHWGWVVHICIGKITIIGLDIGLLPGQCQAIIWTSVRILLIEPLGTNFSEILIRIKTFPFKQMHLKMSSVKWRPFCLSLNVCMASKYTEWHIMYIISDDVLAANISCYQIITDFCTG